MAIKDGRFVAVGTAAETGRFSLARPARSSRASLSALGPTHPEADRFESVKAFSVPLASTASQVRIARPWGSMEAAQRRSFVGRDCERELFRSALAREELPFVLLYIHGPAGIGKTSLLRELTGMVREGDRPASPSSDHLAPSS